MPRNGSGTYALPAGNPVADGTLVTSAWGNTTLNDVAAAMTGSLSADGQTPLTAPLKLTNGTALSPSLTFNSETTTGLYRSAINSVALSVAGTDKIKCDPSTLSLSVSTVPTVDNTYSLGSATNKFANIYSTTSASSKQQLGLSVTPANNFTITAEADNGTMKLARGNAGATTQDIITVDATGKATFPQGIDIGSAFGFRNRLINGDAKIWQRGTSFSVPNGSYLYMADRWRATATGGTGIIDSGGTNDLLALWGGAGVTSTYVSQIIEAANSKDLVSKNVTISFLASSTDSRSVYVALYRNTSLDNPSGAVIVDAATVSSTGTLAKKSVTFAVPASANLGMFILVGTIAPLSGAQNILLDELQLEEGSVATPFEHRPYGLELSLCQRYLPAVIGVNGKDDFAIGATATASSGTVWFTFIVEPRVPPTGITVIGNFSATTASADQPLNSVAFNRCGKNMCLLSISSSTSLWIPNSTLIAATSSVGAKLLFTGCEL